MEGPYKCYLSGLCLRSQGLSDRISIGCRQFKNIACLVYSVWFLSGCVLCVKWQELTPIRARSRDCEEENVTKSHATDTGTVQRAIITAR